MTTDRFDRIWDLPAEELCDICGQPDNCGDCNHERLSTEDVAALGGKEPLYVAVYAASDRDEQWATVWGPFATEEEAKKVCAKMARWELLELHADEEEASAEYRAEESLERDSIAALSDKDVINEHNLGEFGTVHTATLQTWKETQ